MRWTTLSWCPLVRVEPSTAQSISPQETVHTKTKSWWQLVIFLTHECAKGKKKEKKRKARKVATMQIPSLHAQICWVRSHGEGPGCLTFKNRLWTTLITAPVAWTMKSPGEGRPGHGCLGGGLCPGPAAWCLRSGDSVPPASRDEPRRARTSKGVFPAALKSSTAWGKGLVRTPEAERAEPSGESGPPHRAQPSPRGRRSRRGRRSPGAESCGRKARAALTSAAKGGRGWDSRACLLSDPRPAAHVSEFSGKAPPVLCPMWCPPDAELPWGRDGLLLRKVRLAFRVPNVATLQQRRENQVPEGIPTCCGLGWDLSLLPELRPCGAYLPCSVNWSTDRPSLSRHQLPSGWWGRFSGWGDDWSLGGGIWERILDLLPVSGKHLAVFPPKPCFADPEC